METLKRVLYDRGLPIVRWAAQEAEVLPDDARRAVAGIFGWPILGDAIETGTAVAEAVACPSRSDVSLDCFSSPGEHFLFVRTVLEDDVESIGPLYWQSDVSVECVLSNSPTLRLDYLKVQPTGRHLGAIFIARLVSRLRSNGFQKITLYAVGSKNDDYNGYYTWTAYGFNIWLDDHLKEAAHRSGFMAASTHELIDRYGADGLKWWKENGYASEAVFDLSPASRHSQFLSRYLELAKVSWE